MLYAERLLKEMISPTYGQLNMEKIADKIFEYYEKNKHYGSGFNLIVGTDSQNFSDTKVVVVVTVQCIGHGGIYFYDVERIDRITSIRMKLNYETMQSLMYADRLLSILEDKKYQEMFMNMNFKIHVDAGTTERSRTKDLIPAIVGWIKSCGFECEVKPDSFVASTIADKISK